MLNHITIMGRLTRDPELRRTGTGTAVANFSVAVERDFAAGDGEKKTDFINCVAWRQTGEFVAKYFHKGSMIAVSGRLEMREWTDSNSNKRTSAEVNAEHVYFAGNKKADDSPAGAFTAPTSAVTPDYGNPDYWAAKAPGKAAAVPASPGEYVLLDDDDDQLPF